MSSDVILFFATFLASGVEAVEALTIVLAVGVVRGWRSTLVGVGAASLVLVAVIAALGPALQNIPIGTLRFVVGALLLAFGVQWLRKAVLRASGYKPLHDEAEAFLREREEARDADSSPSASIRHIPQAKNELENTQRKKQIPAMGAGKPTIVFPGIELAAKSPISYC